jgi:peptidyl-tRNA hydrolase, PTH1 family
LAGLFPLVVGLGNPGPAYRHTRHNIGFAVLDHWAAQHGGAWKPLRFADAEACQLPQGVWLVKPQSYMNCSGPVISRCMHWFKWSPQQVMVVVDDVHLSLGRLRLRGSGSDGGHNGLRSIQTALGTPRYPRLRCGVGEAGEQKDLKNHVLERFRAEEKKTVEHMTARAVEALHACQAQGLEAVMTAINGAA